MSDNLELLRLRAKAKLKLQQLKLQQQNPQEQSSRPALSEMQYTPDSNVVGPAETFLRTATEVATGGIRETLINRAEQLFAEMPSIMGGRVKTFGKGKIVPNSAQFFDKKQQEAEALQGQAITEASSQENPTAAMLGSVVGTVAQAVATAKPSTEIVNALGEATKTTASAFKSLADDFAAGTLRISDTLLKRIGGTKGVQKIGQLLNDSGVTSVPGTLRMLAKRVAEPLKTAGATLQAAYTKLDKAIPEDQLVSKMDWISNLKNLIKSDSVEKGFKFGASEASALEDRLVTILQKLPDNKPLKPSELWKAAQLIDAQSGRVGGKVASELENSTKDWLINGSAAIRRHLVNLGKDVAPELADTNDTYRLLNIAYKNIKSRADLPSQVKNFVGNAKSLGGAFSQTAASSTLNTIHTLMSKGPEALGKYYPMLAKEIGKGGLAPITRHAYLMVNDDNYRELVNNLVPTTVEKGTELSQTQE